MRVLESQEQQRRDGRQEGEKSVGWRRARRAGIFGGGAPGARPGQRQRTPPRRPPMRAAADRRRSQRDRTRIAHQNEPRRLRTRAFSLRLEHTRGGAAGPHPTQTQNPAGWATPRAVSLCASSAPSALHRRGRMSHVVVGSGTTRRWQRPSRQRQDFQACPPDRSSSRTPLWGEGKAERPGRGFPFPTAPWAPSGFDDFRHRRTRRGDLRPLGRDRKWLPATTASRAV